MQEILTAFCEQKAWFVRKLVATGDRPLLENTNEPDWGALNGGPNWLGKLLMDQRRDYQLQSVNSTPQSPNVTTNKPSPTATKKTTNQTPPSQNPNCDDMKQNAPKQKEQEKPKVLYFGDSMPDRLPLDIPGMKCSVKSHSGARVTVPKTAGSGYVPSATLLKNHAVRTNNPVHLAYNPVQYWFIKESQGHLIKNGC